MCVYNLDIWLSLIRKIRDQKKFLGELTERYSEGLVNEFFKNHLFDVLVLSRRNSIVFFFFIDFMLQLLGPCQPSC